MGWQELLIWDMRPVPPIADAAKVRLRNSKIFRSITQRHAVVDRVAGFFNQIRAKLAPVLVPMQVAKVRHTIVCSTAIDVVGEAVGGAFAKKGCRDNAVNPPSDMLAAINDVQALISVAVKPLLQNLRFRPRLANEYQRPNLAVIRNLVAPLTPDNRAPFRHSLISFCSLGHSMARAQALQV